MAFDMQAEKYHLSCMRALRDFSKENRIRSKKICFEKTAPETPKDDIVSWNGFKVLIVFLPSDNSHFNDILPLMT